MSQPPKEEWKEEFREYFDKTLKTKKPTMKNLDREICISFIEKTLAAERARIAEQVWKKWISTDIRSDYEAGQFQEFLQDLQTP